MGIRDKIAERERLQAKKRYTIKQHLKTVGTCVAKAKEEHLPTAEGMEAIHNILEILLKDKGL